MQENTQQTDKQSNSDCTRSIVWPKYRHLILWNRCLHSNLIIINRNQKESTSKLNGRKTLKSNAITYVCEDLLFCLYHLSSSASSLLFFINEFYDNFVTVTQKKKRTNNKRLIAMKIGWKFLCFLFSVHARFCYVLRKLFAFRFEITFAILISVCETLWNSIGRLFQKSKQ